MNKDVRLLDYYNIKREKELLGGHARVASSVSYYKKQAVSAYIVMHILLLLLDLVFFCFEIRQTARHLVR